MGRRDAPKSDVDRIVKALNALALAMLSMRREMAAGPLDPQHERFVAEEESWAAAISRR
jgi:hypothetical protein